MSQATFVKLDAITQGNWRGVYGGDGYEIAAIAAVPPSYAVCTIQGDSIALGSIDTTGRALMLNGVGKISAWYSATSFSFTVNITDGSTRQVAIYCLDWDAYQGGRVQTIQVKDSNTGAVYDSRTLSAFENGVWALYTVTGSVTFTFATLNGNTVVSGVMFAPAAAPAGGSPPVPPSVVSAPAYTVIMVTTPAAPAHTSVLGWAPVAGASGYNVYRGTTSGGPYTKLTASPVTAPAYQDLAIVAGTTYYYCTTAIVNGVESAYAVQVPVTIPTP